MRLIMVDDNPTHPASRQEPGFHF